MLKSLNDLLNQVKDNKNKRIAVASAEDLDILEIVDQSNKMGLADFILIGDSSSIKNIAVENGYDLNVEIINEIDNRLAAEKAVELVKDGEADAVMKGLLHTATFLKAVLNKDRGLNRGNLISQISVYDKEYGEGLQLLTDCAINIQPDLQEKKQIIENAVELALKLGYKKAKVALLSAIEVVNPSIPDTLDAAMLSKMGDRGQIKNCIIDGPLALDNAISTEAARHKKITGEVAGDADILVVPNLQCGNMLSKSLVYFAKKKIAAAVIGAAAPIVMTSRTDTMENKLLSVALANYISN